MSLWRDILRVLGLTNDARVHISAPGINVVITGDPAQVRHLLGVVKHELERNAARRELGGRRKSIGSSQVVRPTDLDEMDSPYVLPEAMVMPVEEPTGELVRTPVDEETVDDPRRRTPTIPAARAEVRVTPGINEANTLISDELDDSASPHAADPTFATDGGPTLSPTDNSDDRSGTDPEVKSS